MHRALHVYLRRHRQKCITDKAHNHPSGLALPSADDIQTTKRLAVALDTVEIALIDHLVFSDDDYVSMAQSGYFKPGESMCVL